MPLVVVGSGLGRTGTMSLKLALEKLLGAPCYHMAEVFAHPEHVAVWHAAARGEAIDWHALFRGYAAAVDWPVASFFEETMRAFPDAIVLHSERDAAAWWESARDTIFTAIEGAPGEWRAMIDELFARRFTTALDDRDAAIAAFERHDTRVRELVPPERLVRWRASDGWGPLCRALGLPEPAEPFPRVNSREEFREAHLKR